MLSNSKHPLIQRAKAHDNRLAIVDEKGKYTYGDLLYASNNVASSLLDYRRDMQEVRIGFLIPPSFDYVAVQWGIWRAGGIAVALNIFHPLAEIEYVLKDSSAEIVVAHPYFEEKLRPIIDK